jgi:hypothetical protein
LRVSHGHSSKNSSFSREKEDPVLATVTLRKKPKLRRSCSTSSIPNEISSYSSIDVEDIDRDDKGNPFLLTEYVNDIYAYVRKFEERL